MVTETFNIAGVPALLCGERADTVWLFVHGQCGCKEEALDFAATVCPRGAQVLAIDLPQHGERQNSPKPLVPWQVIPELRAVMAFMRPRWNKIGLRANSIGAWLCLQSFADEAFVKCLFVSPLLDMSALIDGMMQAAGVMPEQLKASGEIATADGTTLSWRYREFAAQHPIARWDSPTALLYAGGDTLTTRKTAEWFAAQFHARLTVMEDGEHWFHTPAQLAVLHRWEDDETN